MTTRRGVAMLALIAVASACGDATSPPVPGSLNLQLTSAPLDSTGALLILVDSGPVDTLGAAGPRVLSTSRTVTGIHLIVVGDLAPGMTLATLAVPDTREPARRLYRVTVLQAAARQAFGYRQLAASSYVVDVVGIP